MLFIDVSMYQGEIDWKRVSQHFKYAYLKAAEGLHWNDPDFRKNRREANRHGIRVGAYHFADFEIAAEEAAHFANIVGRIGRKDLRPVLDLEKKVPAGVNPSIWARNFNKVVRKKLGVSPAFYSYAPYIEAMHAQKPIGDGLWLASYGRNDGVEHPFFVPLPWHKAVAHQFTSKGKVPGIKGDVDVSHAKRLRPLLAHPILGRL